MKGYLNGSLQTLAMTTAISPLLIMMSAMFYGVLYVALGNEPIVGSHSLASMATVLAGVGLFVTSFWKMAESV